MKAPAWLRAWLLGRQIKALQRQIWAGGYLSETTRMYLIGQVYDLHQQRTALQARR